MTSIDIDQRESPFSLILKTALPYFLPLFVLAALVLYRFQTQDAEEDRRLIKAGEKLHLEIVDESVSNLLREIAVDLKMLSSHHELEAALETGDALRLAPLTQEFVTFSEIKGFYDQIRLLDLTGMERIRVNHVDGRVVVVPPDELQNKSHRSYFKEILRLDEGAFYFSPFDLNIEKGQVEQPLKPVLRIGVPVFDRHGQKRGLLILNYFGRNVLDHLREYRSKGLDEYLFVGSENFWFRRHQEEGKWQFIHRDASHPTFQERFPEAWKRIQETESGQFFSPEGLITTRQINASRHVLKGMTTQLLNGPQSPAGIKPLSWKLVSIIPTDFVYANSNKGARTYLVIFVLISIVSGTGSFSIAQKKVKREQAERARQQVSKEREALLAELASKNAELERFTYTVSHDLKSPLITIKGFLGLLEKDIALGDKARIQSDIKRISNATIKMKRLLEELLELSRIGRVDSTLVEVPLGDLVREAVALVKGQLTQRNVQVKIASDLPTVFVDAPRIREVFQNLLDNAVKFMGKQSGPIIAIEARRQNGEVIVTVRDNGMGLDPKYHEVIFGLFNRLDPKEEGTGIGLAIVKRIIEVHHGRIWVESEGAGKGSTFCCTFPVKQRPSNGHSGND